MPEIEIRSSQFSFNLRINQSMISAAISLWSLVSWRTSKRTTFKDSTKSWLDQTLSISGPLIWTINRTENQGPKSGSAVWKLRNQSLMVVSHQMHLQKMQEVEIDPASYYCNFFICNDFICSNYFGLFWCHLIRFLYIYTNRRSQKWKSPKFEKIFVVWSFMISSN